MKNEGERVDDTSSGPFRFGGTVTKKSGDPRGYLEDAEYAGFSAFDIDRGKAIRHSYTGTEGAVFERHKWELLDLDANVIATAVWQYEIPDSVPD